MLSLFMQKGRRTWNTFEEIREAAEEGDPQAQCYLGVCFQNGQGTQQDYNEAYTLYVKWTQLQPADADGWFSLAEFALGRNCPRTALPAFERGIVLDPSNANYADKDKALKLVNAGKAIC